MSRLKIQPLSGRRRCIFCGGIAKLSREHIFGDWLRVDFPRDASTTHTHGVIKFPVPGSGLSQPALATRQRQGHSGSKKVRVVCKKCNETWMSALENTTKPILRPLIKGQACPLTPEIQKVLATWAAKTVMAAEHVDPTQAVVTQAERDELKNNLAPPLRGWHIWIAPYSGQDWRDLGLYQHMGKITAPDPATGKPSDHYIQWTVIGLGQLIIFILNTDWPRIWDGLDEMNFGNIPKIWPPKNDAISWPPPFILNDEDASRFLKLLARVLEMPVN